MDMDVLRHGQMIKHLREIRESTIDDIRECNLQDIEEHLLGQFIATYMIVAVLIKNIPYVGVSENDFREGLGKLPNLVESLDIGVFGHIAIHNGFTVAVNKALRLIDL